jgi:hypothetical protein
MCFFAMDLMRFQAASHSASVTPLHLLDAGNRIAHASSVMDGFFALLGESEVLVGDMIAARFGDLGYACQ